MSRIFLIALGVLSAIGGFVDIGDLVFNAQAGAVFGYKLLWVVVIGVVGIIAYSEMCGRVSAVSGRPVFDAIRDRVGYTFGFVTLAAATLVTFMTLAAELGGMALSLQLLSNLPYRLLVGLGFVFILVILLKFSFSFSENLFSMLGLALLAFAVAAVKLHPHWNHVAHGLIPNVPRSSDPSKSPVVFGYFAIGLLGAAMTPYEVYFYSSGAVEDHWTLKELSIDKLTAIVGFSLGGLLSMAIMVVSAVVLLPRSIGPDFLGTVALPVQQALGTVGLLAIAAGFFFATGGAAVETALSGAYNIAQFSGWEWGKYRSSLLAPRWFMTWIGMLALGTLITLTGINPIQLTEYSVIFSTVALPLTYLPILLVANDDAYMGDKRNGRLSNFLGVAYFVLILVVAVSAIPLMLLSHGGQG